VVAASAATAIASAATDARTMWIGRTILTPA
jgi:hypothetical protein